MFYDSFDCSVLFCKCKSVCCKFKHYGHLATQRHAHKKNPTKTKISARARDLKVPGRLNSAVLLQLTAGYELKLENLPPRFHTSELQLLDSSRLWSGMKRTTDQVTDSSLDDALCLSLSRRSARFPWIDNSSWVGPHSQHFPDRTGWLTD